MLFHQILLSESKLGRNMFSIFYAAAPSLSWTTITKVLQKTTWQRDETIFIFKVYVSSPRHGWFCEHFWSVLYLWDRNVIRCTLLTSWPIYNVTPIMDFRLIYSIKISKRWWHLGYLIMVTFFYHHYDHSMISVLEETNFHIHWDLRLNKYAPLQCWGSKIQSKFHWMAMGNIIGSLP